jgi:hypothetical protein
MHSFGEGALAFQIVEYKVFWCLLASFLLSQSRRASTVEANKGGKPVSAVSQLF